jgi:hypothetical protein
VGLLPAQPRQSRLVLVRLDHRRRGRLEGQLPSLDAVRERVQEPRRHVTVGSDSGYIYNLYGFGYVQEMELLREAGFSSLEVIHSATQEGARLLGHEDQVGTIRVGRKADLVVVQGNPLANMKLLFDRLAAPQRRHWQGRARRRRSLGPSRTASSTTRASCAKEIRQSVLKEKTARGMPAGQCRSKQST